MKISQIYEKYKIMPQLQTHMFRVAGVASIICDNYKGNVNKDKNITAALVHDIANIIKFEDLNKFPESLKPRGLRYWEKTRKEFIDQYGLDEHYATVTVINEIGLGKNIIELLDGLEFARTKEIAKSQNFEKKILKYSDMRVSPYGIERLEGRLLEIKKRYVNEKRKWTSSEYDYLKSLWMKIEKQIFSQCKIKPEDITEEKVTPLIEKLKDFDIKTK